MSVKTVKVINKTKGTILAEKAEVADTAFSRLKGLLGREDLREGEGLVISPCSSIHTFFMRFSIDVVFLDRQNRVVAMKDSLSPWRMFGTFFKGRLVIELPVGILRRTQTFHSDLIEIIYNKCPL